MPFVVVDGQDAVFLLDVVHAVLGVRLAGGRGGARAVDVAPCLRRDEAELVGAEAHDGGGGVLRVDVLDPGEQVAGDGDGPVGEAGGGGVGGAGVFGEGVEVEVVDDGGYDVEGSLWSESAIRLIF